MGVAQDGSSGIASRIGLWLRRGSLVQQVGNVFNLFAVLVLVLAAAALLGTYHIDKRTHTLADLTQIAFLSSEMSREVSNAKDDMGAYRARGRDPLILQEAIDHAQNARDLNVELQAAASRVDGDLVSNPQELDTALANVSRVISEVGAASPDVIEQESFLGPRYDAIDVPIATLNSLNASAAERVESYAGDGMEELQLLLVSLAMLSAIAVGLVFVGKRLVARQIVDPISAISETSHAIAEGRTDVSIPGQERDDEIGTLAKALTVLREVQGKAAEHATRELEEKFESEKEREREREERIALVQSLADKFEKTIGDVASEVAAASAQLHNAADELAKNVENSSDRVVTADTNLQEVSSGMTGAAAATDEFVLSITEVSKQAATSSDRAQRAASAATDADSTIGDMTDSASKIGQIVEVIAGIAQRTNLLALNASIEAARGSDAGRGFAVVAAEVKELAAQTSRATSEAEALIQLVQDSTGKSASALTTIANEVMQLQSASIMIASAVDQQAVAGQDLARSIDMAARNTEIVSSSFREVSELAVSTGGTASQLRDSSGHLIKQSERLRQQVAEFLQHVRAA
ncbi:methyl-accepting chemotaxis protein [Aurantiacibacter sp. MUD61]|uniref:methyl-accepting chemotaxis protein n=1 Tax=Aurantiacibacter sp. MUD61 TaxID=3009083 RepID=UPI0022F0B202|nr:HAMP domain-containing methyl-accepting chemotaxis protein [Aurantiacibacter sp. MUD61]